MLLAFLNCLRRFKLSTLEFSKNELRKPNIFYGVAVVGSGVGDSTVGSWVATTSEVGEGVKVGAGVGVGGWHIS